MLALGLGVTPPGQLPDIDIDGVAYRAAIEQVDDQCGRQGAEQVRGDAQLRGVVLAGQVAVQLAVHLQRHALHRHQEAAGLHRVEGGHLLGAELVVQHLQIGVAVVEDRNVLRGGHVVAAHHRLVLALTDTVQQVLHLQAGAAGDVDGVHHHVGLGDHGLDVVRGDAVAVQLQLDIGVDLPYALGKHLHLGPADIADHHVLPVGVVQLVAAVVSQDQVFGAAAHQQLDHAAAGGTAAGDENHRLAQAALVVAADEPGIAQGEFAIKLIVIQGRRHGCVLLSREAGILFSALMAQQGPIRPRCH